MKTSRRGHYSNNRPKRWMVFSTEVADFAESLAWFPTYRDATLEAQARHRTEQAPERHASGLYRLAGGTAASWICRGGVYGEHFD